MISDALLKLANEIDRFQKIIEENNIDYVQNIYDYFLELNKYVSESSRQKVCINVGEIASIREYQYDSFRPSIAEITLKCGEKIIVWETYEQIIKSIHKQQEKE